MYEILKTIKIRKLFCSMWHTKDDDYMFNSAKEMFCLYIQKWVIGQCHT